MTCTYLKPCAWLLCLSCPHRLKNSELAMMLKTVQVRGGGWHNAAMHGIAGHDMQMQGASWVCAGDMGQCMAWRAWRHLGDSQVLLQHGLGFEAFHVRLTCGNARQLQCYAAHIMHAAPWVPMLQEAVVIAPRIAFALRPTMGEWYYIR